MNRIAVPQLLAGAIVLAASAWPHVTQAQNINPVCGGTLHVGSSTYTLGAANPYSGACGTGNIHHHILGSPSGLANPNGSSDFPGMDLFVEEGGYAEFWVAFLTQYDAPFGDQHLDCSDPLVPTALPYTEVTGQFYRPTFGGSGLLGFYVKWSEEGYGIIATTDGRSTDIDGDGDTDEDDGTLMTSAITNQTMSCDLNWSGTVDQADRDIIILEAFRRDGSGQPYQRMQCLDEEETGFPYGYTYHVTAPATISNLSVTRTDASTVRLSWTAPADDGSSGSAATAYEVRRSSSAITSAGAFASATVVSSPPTPASPGSTQTMDVTLAAGTSQYFAIRTRDDMDNLSEVSNSPQIQNTAPAAVTNLGGSSGREMARLNWTAPGEDGQFGTATSYDLRYIQGGTISEANWGSAISVSAPTPGPAGTSECVVVTQLPDCASLSFALKTEDASGQWSAISNVKSVSTKCTGSLSFECGGSSARPDREGRDLELSLGSFAPNPTRRGGEIVYSIPNDAAGEALELSVFDVSGRRQAALATGVATPGRHSVRWELASESGQRVRPGIYFVRLRLGETVLSRPMTVVAP